MTLRSKQRLQRGLLNTTALPQINPVRNCSCKIFDSTQSKYNHVVNNCRLSQRRSGCFPLKSTGERLSHDLLQFWQCSTCVSPGVQDLHGPLYNSAPLLGLWCPPVHPPPRLTHRPSVSGQAAHQGNMSARAETKTRGPTRDPHGSAFTGEQWSCSNWDHSLHPTHTQRNNTGNGRSAARVSFTSLLPL